MFDYATGKWAPAKFKNYVTGEVTTTTPSTDVKLPVGTLDCNPRPQLRADRARRLGRTEIPERRRQSHPSVAPRRRAITSGRSHRQLKTVAKSATNSPTTACIANNRVNIDTSIAGLVHLVKAPAPAWLATGLDQIDDALAADSSPSAPATPASRSRNRSRPSTGRSLASPRKSRRQHISTPNQSQHPLRTRRQDQPVSIRARQHPWPRPRSLPHQRSPCAIRRLPRCRSR